MLKVDVAEGLKRQREKERTYQEEDERIWDWRMWVTTACDVGSLVARMQK